VLTNSGSTAITNGTVSLGHGPFSIISPAAFVLAGFGSTNIAVSFAPPGGGSFTNQIVFSSDGGNSTNQLSGTGAVIPVASFTGGPTAGLKPLAVIFTDNSTGTITSRFWDFGDGSTSNTTATTLSHTYEAVGTNTVTLTVAGPGGTNVLTKTNYIVVTNP